jgi:hypothetical protein
MKWVGAILWMRAEDDSVFRAMNGQRELHAAFARNE